MPPVKPMLDEIELKLVQKIDTAEEQVQAQHGVPALEGDFLQGLGRRATSVTLNGVMTGTEAAEDLKTLREKFRAAEPVSFVADIATATKVDQVLIEEMGVRELAGTPERFEYALTLRELVTPPPPETEEPPPIPPIPPQPIPSVEVGTLVVEVEVEGEPDFDFSTVMLTLENNGAAGSSRLLTNRTEGVWVEENLEPGSYTASAVVESPVAMAGEEQATVRGGETTQIKITLRPGVVIAKAFVVHFRFDNAFIEPCLRQVLRRVFDYAQDHPDEKLVIIGHTDLVGGAPYNQKLSERRARSAYAFLTFGTSAAHRAAAIDDWDNLRVSPPVNALNDNWDRREYQYMLQDLGYYRGRIDEPFADDPEPPRFSNADSAIRGFQADHALPVTGIVNGATWRALVTEYLSLDALAVPDSQFLPNANESGCNGGLLKWLGFGETDPVKNTEDAWRPNRRTEMLFVRTDKLPNAVAKPETFDMPEPGVVGTTWCLNVGAPAPPPSFLARGQSQPNKWLVVPAEPGKVTISGVIKFADETRAANMKYVLIAPDGEFLREREDGTPDPVAERPSGPKRGRGVPGRTDEQGNFSYPAQTPVGVYILQLPDLVNPSVARESNEPPTNAVGNIVCLRVTPSAPGTEATPADDASSLSFDAQTGPATIGATIHPAPPPPVVVNPLIELASNVVVVKRSYTNPARVRVTLKTSARFPRNGTLTRSSDAIRFFTSADPGATEITFDGSDNVFPGGRLSDPDGVQLFAEARTPSATTGGFTLTLTLDPATTPGATPAGSPLAVTMTALELTLDIHASPPAPGVEPNRLPQPPDPVPDPPPDPATATDKWFGGRIVTVQSGNTQERVLLSVSMRPTDFTGELTLRQVRVAGTTIGALDNAKLNLFDNRTATAGETPLANPFNFAASTVGATGRSFGVEGKATSPVLRDVGFQLGIAGAEFDADRVAVTVGVGVAITLASPFVVVKKPHTNPARRSVTLFTTAATTRNATLQRSRNDIRFFIALTGGTEITFNGVDNVFTGAQLSPSPLVIFAEGATPSPTTNAPDLVTLTLTLDPAGTGPPAGQPATARMTSVQLTLDIFMARTAPAAAPQPMQQVPATPPAAGTTATDKWFGGRFVQVQDAAHNAGRALLAVRAVQPAGFAATLVLRQVAIAANNVTGLAARAQLFDTEIFTAGEVAKANPFEVNASTVPAGGLNIFVEAASVSAALRDTGFQLGIKDFELDGDRVAVTSVAFTRMRATINSTPPNTVRAGFPAPAAHTFDSTSLSDSFTVNTPLVLMRNAQPDIALDVTAAPAGLPIRWQAIRNPADHASLGNAAAVPTVTPNAVTANLATLNANARGSFRVRAFIDTNGNNTFEAGEPSLPLNLVLADATVVADNSAAHNAGVISATLNAAGLSIVNGVFPNVPLSPADLLTAGMAMELIADVTGGGADGLLGLNQVFSGVVNMVRVRDVHGFYRDNTVVPPTDHNLTFVASSNAGSATGNFGGRPMFVPGDPPMVLHILPLLDSGRPGAGTGGDTALLSRSGPHVAAARPVGQRWTIRCVDSPSFGFQRTHPVNASAILRRVHYELRFGACFCFWTNTTASRAATGDPADRLYSVIRIVNWQILADFNTSFPAAGAPVLTVNTPHRVSVSSRTTIAPIGRAQDNGVEVRPPAGIQIAVFDGSN
ncbi:MAG TPA: OmpA family protein [Pyrinomonadaceae bacterium]|jgi:outer membrane protein OmpA-like peptidoglycan-associated protein|nr:OmpA family protein [Pyrinomonadaceae bacterium]